MDTSPFQEACDQVMSLQVCLFSTFFPPEYRCNNKEACDQVMSLNVCLFSTFFPSRIPLQHNIFIQLYTG